MTVFSSCDVCKVKRLLLLMVIALFLFTLSVLVPVEKLAAEQQCDQDETGQEINTEKQPVKETDVEEEYDEDESYTDSDLDGWC